MAGITAIQGVDDTLRDLSTQAVAGLDPPAAITVGPLDRDDDRNRLNWFLYRITPHPAFANMEPPRNGWRTSRGRPPLALQLHYLLTVHAAPLSANGDEEQFGHLALAAVMQAIHDHAILPDSDPVVSDLAKPLVEPLRLSIEGLDLDTLSKIWTAASESLRLSVGYEVSLVVVDSTAVHRAGPPVRERRVAVAPTLGPQLDAPAPPRVHAGAELTVAVTGLTAGAVFTLSRVDGTPGDPAGPAGGWPLTVLSPAPAGTVRLRLDPVPAHAALAPGARRLEVSALVEGLPAGRDRLGVVVVPAVTTDSGPVAPGATVQLTTAHAASDVEVFLDGRALPPDAVAFVSPTRVDVDIPATTAPGPLEVLLRAGRVSGPPYTGLVVS